MKRSALVLIFVSSLALAQDKPRVFIQGKGSQDVTTSGTAAGGKHWGSWGSNSTLDSHDEAMEVTKDLQKDCSGVIVTLNQSNADYTVMLNRESKHNRGLIRTNSQIQVANRLGDVLGTNATRTVGNASKDACQLIVADWSQNGRIAAPDSPTPTAAVSPVVPATTAVSPEKARLETVSAVQSNLRRQPQNRKNQRTLLTAEARVSGDAAKRLKQHQACLDLAKDNPSIVCQ